MGREINTPARPGGDRFVVPLDRESALGTQGRDLGGKARSLLRLAQLGLPTPVGVAITPLLFDTLRAAGPPLPDRLQTAADLEALEEAREALGTTAFPAGFEGALRAALRDAENTHRRGAVPGQFAVRSSADLEDRAGALGAGVYASRLPVSTAGVPTAIREVLASFLTPAAWVYATSRRRVTGSQRQHAPGGAVLIHPFQGGDAWGTAAVATTPWPANGGDRATAVTSEAVLLPVRIETTRGHPTPSARTRIEAAARAAASIAHGAVELEWVADRDDVTFLQLRAYQAAPTGPADDAADRLGLAPTTIPAYPPADTGWSWDAAHNPAPLSPAQTGLVQLVDGLCRTDFRQVVVGGYLFWRRSDATASGAPVGRARDEGLDNAADARTIFDQLRTRVEADLDALGDRPPLEAALAVFVSAYEPLFGVVAPASAAARASLTTFLEQVAPEQLRALPALLSGVPSVAASRRAAVASLLTATTTAARQEALQGYLRRFGDESPRWDVAEPTLRETPERLLLLAANPPPVVLPVVGEEGDATAPWQTAATLARAGLSSSERGRFDALLAAARGAVAVGEDDDALFARLQAGVRRALLAVGRRLVAEGRLDVPDDVFLLPLTVTRGLTGPGSSARAGDDLKGLAEAARRALLRAAGTPPPALATPGSSVVQGQGGAGGRFIGRALHHPSRRPLGRDVVLIAATLLPTELPLLAPGALVVESGHALGHVAAQARERGIPAVVAATGARSVIPEGALVLVDGDRGEVVLLEN